MRTFKCISKEGCLSKEYIEINVEYTLNQLTDSVFYCRNTPEVSCSCMRIGKFKQALREGAIIFTD